MLVGTDPELFLKNKDNTPYSAVGAIGGSKNKPRYIGEIGYQEDNVMVEFNTPPTDSAGLMIGYIQEAKDTIESLTHKELAIVPSLTFPWEDLEN